MKRLLPIALLLLALASATHAQGFANLNFESATIVTNGAPQFFCVASDAIPGWTAYIGSTAQAYVLNNTESTGSTAISLLGTNAGSISGDYSILLYGGLSAPAASIVQTGTVPISAASILFEAEGSGSLLVSLGDQYLTFSALSTGANYTLYGATIPAGMAEQSEPLGFSVPEGLNNGWEIDNISFSSSPTPEPRIWALIAVGGLLLARRRRKASAA